MTMTKKNEVFCEFCGSKLLRKREINSLTCDHCYNQGKMAWVGFNLRQPTQYGERLEQGFALLHQYED